MDWIYDDRGSGAKQNVIIHRPRVSSSWNSLGDVAIRGKYGSKPRSSIIVRAAKTSLLAPPASYTRIWKDSGSGGTYDGSFWRPNPQPGYTCLGTVAVKGYSAPSTDLIKCVDSKYVVRATRRHWQQQDPYSNDKTEKWTKAPVWTDRGSGADRDVALWNVYNGDHGIATSFIATSNYNDYGGDVYWAINKCPCFDSG